MRPATLRRRLALAAAGAVLAATGIAAGLAPDARADTPGCETIRWGFFGKDRRTICDGPIQPDGNWLRARVFWSPAYYKPATCTTSGGTYYATTNCYPGGWVDERLIGKETYWVNAGNVLPDEPGHLPAGADILR